VPAGRPRIISSPEEMVELAERYFAECDNRIVSVQQVCKETGKIIELGINKPVPYTVPGLALALGLSGRASLHEYARREEYFDTVKMLMSRIEQQRIEAALEGKQNPRIAEFDLRNNFGYTDKREIVQETTHKIDNDADLQQRIEERKQKYLEGMTVDVVPIEEGETDDEK